MIELRPANFSDYNAIAKIHIESWQKNYRNILSDRFLDNEIEKDRLKLWQNRLASAMPGNQITVAVNNENIVGFSCLLLNYDSLYGSLLDNLHVRQEFQNSGIGKMLMKNCARMILEKANARKMYLWVYEANQNARKAYEHLGGTHIDTVRKSNVDGTEANACRYVWEDVSSFG
jgi:ribosomal protein S18 acetylase RimI-like enzyme